MVRDYQVFQMTGEEEALPVAEIAQDGVAYWRREEERHRHIGEHVRRGQSHEAGAREVEWCLRVDAGAVRKFDGQQREDKATKVIGACHAACPTEGAWLAPLSIGACSGRGGSESRFDPPDSRRWTVGRTTNGSRRARKHAAKR